MYVLILHRNIYLVSPRQRSRIADKQILSRKRVTPVCTSPRNTRLATKWNPAVSPFATSTATSPGQRAGSEGFLKHGLALSTAHGVTLDSGQARLDRVGLRSAATAAICALMKWMLVKSNKCVYSSKICWGHSNQFIEFFDVYNKLPTQHIQNSKGGKSRVDPPETACSGWSPSHEEEQRGEPLYWEGRGAAGQGSVSAGRGGGFY